MSKYLSVRRRKRLDLKVVAYTDDGHPLTAMKLRVLVELAKWPDGVGAIYGVMDGGVLAALVQFGLAQRVSPDRIGGLRYALSEKGREAVASIGIEASPPRPRLSLASDSTLANPGDRP